MPATKQRMKLVADVIRHNEYIPVVPTAKQMQFLAAPEEEKGYGGAAGGGKSIALLMDALLPVKNQNYGGLILRRTYPELAMADAIMDVAKQWLNGTDAKWNERDKVFYFPKYGSRIQFGFMEREAQKYRYQSAQFQKISFDEATQFPWSQYSYLRSRLRRSVKVKVKPGLASATNPGGIGHDWYYRWFVKNVDPGRLFVPALLDDNPHLMREEYLKMLEGLSPIEQEQLAKGRWVRDELGHPFLRAYWEDDDNRRYVPGITRIDVEARWIFVDSALKDKKDSAFNAIIVVELLKNWKVRVRYVWRDRVGLPELVTKLEGIAEEYNYDQRLRGVVVEDKASGPSLYQTVRSGGHELLAQHLAMFMPAGSKAERWGQASLWCERGCVELPWPTPLVADWLFPFEEELYGVPDTEYADMADAFSMGLIYLEHLLATGYHARKAVGA